MRSRLQTKAIEKGKGEEDENIRTLKLIEDYAAHYNALSDEKAQSLLAKVMTLDEDRLKLRKAYLPQFQNVLPAVKVARYYQIENKMNAVVNFELAREIPFARWRRGTVSEAQPRAMSPNGIIEEWRRDTSEISGFGWTP